MTATQIETRGGRKRKFRRGQKVRNNLEHYGDERNNPIGLKPDELQRGNINWLSNEQARAGRMGR